MRTLLAIPCYNCAPQIIRVINSLKKNRIEGIDQIIFVNNKSTDNTETVIKENAEDLGILLNNSKNYGLGGTFKIVHEYAINNNFENFIFFHGDDQAEINDIPLFISTISQNKNLSAVIGARFMNGSSLENYSLVRTLGNKFFNILFSLFTRREIFEIGSGLNLYKTNDLTKLDVSLWPNHIAFDVNILLGLVEKELDFTFLPIHWNERDQRSNADNINTGMIVLSMLLKWVCGIDNKSEQWRSQFSYEEVPL